MTEETIFTILLVIITFDFALERILSFLNRKSAKKPIPQELEGIYNQEKYAKSQAYNEEVSRFGNFSATFSFVLLVLAIYNGWFGALDHWIRTFSPFSLVSPLIFFGILYVISDVINTPFAIFRNFVIEAKYGFNKMTVKTYILDKIKPEPRFGARHQNGMVDREVVERNCRAW